VGTSAAGTLLVECEANRGGEEALLVLARAFPRTYLPPSLSRSIWRAACRSSLDEILTCAGDIRLERRYRPQRTDLHCTAWPPFAESLLDTSPWQSDDLPMEPTQADLDLALLHVKQLEARVSDLRGKIARLREHSLPIDAEEEQLAALLRAIEVLKIHLGKMTDPGRSRSASK
jgi:uncharacterized small protein (DUF1192 family)